jgi:hypothetical protein
MKLSVLDEHGVLMMQSLSLRDILSWGGKSHVTQNVVCPVLSLGQQTCMKVQFTTDKPSTGCGSSSFKKLLRPNIGTEFLCFDTTLKTKEFLLVLKSFTCSAPCNYNNDSRMVFQIFYHSVGLQIGLKTPINVWVATEQHSWAVGHGGYAPEWLNAFKTNIHVSFLAFAAIPAQASMSHNVKRNGKAVQM